MQSAPAILWQYPETDKNWDSSFDLTSDKLVCSFLLGVRLYYDNEVSKTH